MPGLPLNQGARCSLSGQIPLCQESSSIPALPGPSHPHTVLSQGKAENSNEARGQGPACHHGPAALSWHFPVGHYPLSPEGQPWRTAAISLEVSLWPCQGTRHLLQTWSCTPGWPQVAHTGLPGSPSRTRGTVCPWPRAPSHLCQGRSPQRPWAGVGGFPSTPGSHSPIFLVLLHLWEYWGHGTQGYRWTQGHGGGTSAISVEC